MVVAFLSVSCATTTKQTNALFKNHQDLPEKAKLSDVPFIKQAKDHCGPATMSMVLSNAGKNIPLETLNSQMFTKGMDGTFQSEMISVARRNGMMALQIHDLKSLLQEIASGNPVIVFQNLGFSFYPHWHYAVALGYDLSGPDIILHSGPDKLNQSDMRLFERSWKLAGHWGLLILRPDQLSATGNELTHAGAAAMLEQLGKLDEALIAYETIQKRWPRSLTALMGAGNVLYTQRKFLLAVQSFKLATKFHPQSAMGWHNLAIAQGDAGLRSDAHRSSEKAMELVSAKDRNAYAESLRDYL
jgi:tetratricopeptide (TPR) repeat protein